tara:strand:+ start:690 stop:1886 length:1197 start_codon:yes stop_codon:yes gene_type:complete
MEEKEEKVVEETTQETNVEETPQVDESKFDSAGDDSVAKVDLSKPPKPKEKNEVKKDNTDDKGVDAKSENAEPVQEQEEVQSETEAQETPVLEEITEEETKEQMEEIAAEATEAIKENLETGKPLPEGVQKLVDFMEETGGDLNDYVKLNKDYDKLDDNALLKEYYSQTKPHLNNEEINFLMEDSFSYNEDEDEEIDIRRKKLALKEQVASAKAYLDGQKSKYYEDIKAGSKLTEEQQKAINFFDRYNKESEANQKMVKKNSDIFTQKTEQVFNDEFKGFEYNVGDKKYRFNVNNAEEVKKAQSDISNFTKKFLDKNSALSDARGYHKSLYTAMNADAIAKHFYEQGKVDAMKDSVAKSKNVDMNPRQSHGTVEAGGIKVRVLGDDANDFKFKIKNKK